MAQLAGNAHWAKPSPLFAHRARPTPLKCKNEYPVLSLGEETAVQAVVGSIVWVFSRLKKPRCWEMSARGYAIHSVCPKLIFFPLISTFRVGPTVVLLTGANGSIRIVHRRKASRVPTARPPSTAYVGRRLPAISGRPKNADIARTCRSAQKVLPLPCV